MEKWFHDELVAAQHDNKKILEANKEHQRKWQKAAQKVVALVKADPNDPAALNGILLLTGEMRWWLDEKRH